MIVRIVPRIALSALAAFWLAAAATSARADDDKVKVTVVAVLASGQHTEIDKRLKDLAPELKKKDPSWTGFEVERSSAASLKVGEKQSFALVDDCEVVIEVTGRNDNGGFSLLMKPPTLGEIKYSCCCSKFFPIITRYETKSKKHLIIAVMVQPCGKKPKP